MEWLGHIRRAELHDHSQFSIIMRVLQGTSVVVGTEAEPPSGSEDSRSSLFGIVSGFQRGFENVVDEPLFGKVKMEEAVVWGLGIKQRSRLFSLGLLTTVVVVALAKNGQGRQNLVGVKIFHKLGDWSGQARRMEGLNF